MWPVAELAELAHAHGAQLFVDAAQLAPHRRDRHGGAGIDFLALSGHKLYAPFGTRRAGRQPLPLGDAAPLLHGGGAIELVTPDDVVWACAPERHEAGSPNVVGAVALAAACRALLDFGMDAVTSHERALSAHLWHGLAHVPGLRRLTLWPDDADRVGVATFTLAGYRDPLLAAILSAEHAIGVRHGCFCAHLLMTRLLGVPDAEVNRLAAELRAGRRPALPGAVRASIGLGTTFDDIDRLVDALHEIASRVERPTRAEHGLERRGVQGGGAFEQHSVTVEPSGIDDHAFGERLGDAHPDVVLGAAELVTAGRRDRDAVRGHPDRGTGEQHMWRAVDGDHEGHQIAVEVSEVAALRELLGDQPSRVGPAHRERPTGGTADHE